MMQTWLLIVAPLLVIHGFFRYIHYLFDQNYKDKIVNYIVVIILNIVSLFVFFYFVHGILFDTFIFWMLVVVFVSSTIQSLFDIKSMMSGISLETSFALVLALGWAGILGFSFLFLSLV